MKTTEFFRYIYKTFGKSAFNNQVTFMKHLFNSSSNLHNILDNYTEDYIYKIFSGKKPLSYNIKNSFLPEINEKGLRDFFNKYITNDNINNLMSKFNIDKKVILNKDKEHFINALIAQFKLLIHTNNTNDLKDIVSETYYRYTKNTNKINVLMLDDDIFRANQYASALNTTLYFHTKITNTIKEFFTMVDEVDYDVYVLDVHMNDSEEYFNKIETYNGWRTGLAVFQELRNKKPDAIVVALTYSTLPEAVEWFTSDDYVHYFYKEDCPPKKFPRDLLDFLQENDYLF